MEFKEINIPEGILQQIDHEESLAEITFEVGNGNYLYPNANLDVLHENTLEDIEKMMEQVHGFMKLLPKRILIHNWSSWKRVEEMDLERARYLLSTDEMSREMLDETQV